ncbi:putative type II secretion system protein D precursor [Thalassoglobus neptunius]|uniref:Putative type II secretion system protein D n=1 Tax=Thalassoglobus neptunius TaxID=1938619 RepID=A0A5C5X3W4_9PLAN|nr:pilus assembly protein N-terminal domain-containing protein [Thalassoglobus neptunius]TWT56822.1 putative type II secretion system protein D precursor [Thalassoglobus neptunius]
MSTRFQEEPLLKSVQEPFKMCGLTFMAVMACAFGTVCGLPAYGQSPHVRRQPDSSQIRQVQATYDARRALDPRIQSMPRSERRLEVIEGRSQLVITERRIRRIAWSDPRIIDVVQFSENEISILGLEQGTTDLWFWFEEADGETSSQPLMYTVTTIRDPSLDENRRIEFGRIERKLALLYPNSKVYLIPMSQKIIVRGQARDSAEAAKILNIIRDEVILQDDGFLGVLGQGNVANSDLTTDDLSDYFSSVIIDELEVPGDFQVSIRVRIAELSRSQLRRLGIDWRVIFDNGAQRITQTLSNGIPTLTGIFEAGDISVIVDALASNGSARVLEDARLVTMSGEPAAFLSGGEFAVPTVVGIGGAQGQQTSFRGFGTSIIATPTIIDNDLIRMQIVPELSKINDSNSVGGIPGLDVRRVQTRVELREGQTIVLGGLFSRREQAEVSRIPLLGELPVLGNYLFNAKQATEDENEVLIIVTPEIVRPMDPDQVPPLPGWYVTHPNDHDLYKYNRIEGNPDMGNYEILPYGNGQGYGQDVGYNFYQPSPYSQSHQTQQFGTEQVPSNAHPTEIPVPPNDGTTSFRPMTPSHSGHTLPGMAPISTEVSRQYRSDSNR